MIKNPPAMWEFWVRSLGWEDPQEEGVATHSNILAWRNPMDRGFWQATVHGVTESDMNGQLSTVQGPLDNTALPGTQRDHGIFSIGHVVRSLQASSSGGKKSCVPGWLEAATAQPELCKQVGLGQNPAA